MASTMKQPDFTAQNPTEYKTAIDDAVNVMKRLAGSFGCHQTEPATMTVQVDAGVIWDGIAATLTNVAQQTTTTITAPGSNSRIDRVVVDALTGLYTVVTGTASPSPVAPAIPDGKLPVAQILIPTGTPAITNSMITDERVSNFANGSGKFVNLTVTGTLDNSSDERLKEDIEDLVDGLELITGLRPVTYQKKSTGARGKRELGFLAQQVQAICPELVGEGSNFLTLNYIGLIAPLVRAVQQQQAQIAELRQQLNK